MAGIVVKVHKTPNGNMIALCDPELLGKTFEEGERQLDLTARFYQGEEMSEEEVESTLNDCYVVNAVGTASVSLLKRLKLIEDDHIITVQDIPHAQCVIER